MPGIHDLAALGDGEVGAKARNLATLIAAGLPVPPGFVIDAAVFTALAGELSVDDPALFGHVLGAAATHIETAELDAALTAEVERRAQSLGAPLVDPKSATLVDEHERFESVRVDGPRSIESGPVEPWTPLGSSRVEPQPQLLVVRSSSTVEDRRRGAAPGLFASFVRVPAADIWTAIRAVWTSALTPLAASYARSQADAARPSIAVIVQPFVDGDPVTVYTRPPNAPTGDTLWIQRGTELVKQARPPRAADHASAHVGRASDRPTSTTADQVPHGTAPPRVDEGSRTSHVGRASDRPTSTSDDDHGAVDAGSPRTSRVNRATDRTASRTDDDAAVDGPRTAHVGRASDRTVTDAQTDEIVLLALEAERAIGATDGADVELVVGADRVWVVQARPIVHVARESPRPPPPMLLAALVADGRTWTLDSAHNPDPLSVAQAELVERVERAGIAPWSMRVCAGYLYSAPRTHDDDRTDDDRPDRSSLPADELRARAATIDARSSGSVPADELRGRAAAIEARIEQALGDDEELAIDDAVARYLAFYAIWANEYVPLISRARAGLTVEQLLGARPSAVEAVLFAAARGQISREQAHARLGSLAPAWDVAVPTFAEDPAQLDDAIERARIVLAERPQVTSTPILAERPPVRSTPAVAGNAIDEVDRNTPVGTASDAHEAARAIDPIARVAADLAERDDYLFARAQWLVRRAILARAETLHWPSGDACWIPFAELVTGQLDLETVRRRAGAARAAAERSSRWAMPQTIGPRAIADERESLRGVGSGGSVVGRVVRVGASGEFSTRIRVHRGDVVVVRAVTPALAVVIAGASALVSESGGILDHGAAMARELGIACVVGCRDAWSMLAEGQLVRVDGDAGVVTLLA